MPKLLASMALLGLWSGSMAIGAQPPPSRPEHTASVEVEFRGCESAGWCRFRIASRGSSSESLYRVRPDGVSPMPGGDTVSIAVRDRLNALLAGMIHQHKRIVLHDLRRLEDGTYAAMVTVNGVDVASDPVLVELRQARAGASR